MDGTRRGCGESLAKSIEVVSEIGDDIRLDSDHTTGKGIGCFQDGFWCWFVHGVGGGSGWPFIFLCPRPGLLGSSVGP